MLKKTLAKHRNRIATPLTFSLKPEIMLDKDYCAELNNSLFEIGGEWEHLPAKKTTYQRIPNCMGIYMFVWNPYFKFKCENECIDMRYIIYIGKANSETSTLKSRYKSEYSKFIHSNPDIFWSPSEMNSRSDRLSKYLNLDHLEYWFLAVNDINQEIDNLEQDLIKLFHPPANNQGKTKKIKARTQKPKTAF